MKVNSYKMPVKGRLYEIEVSPTESYFGFTWEEAKARYDAAMAEARGTL